MSSSLNSSPWIDETPKKRIPSMRKTVRKAVVPKRVDTDNFQNQEWDNNPIIPRNDDADHDDDDDNKEVNHLLEKMTLLNVDNDGSSLANFNPISYPENSEIEDRILPPDYNRWKKTTTTSNFGLDNSNTVHNPSEYNQAYEISHNKPNYIDHSNNSNNNNNGDNKNISDRLSYIIHLLEEQQNEKTNNTLEEAIMYLLLGTFVIFVVDSFSRGGKYVR